MAGQQHELGGPTALAQHCQSETSASHSRAVRLSFKTLCTWMREQKDHCTGLRAGRKKEDTQGDER